MLAKNKDIAKILIDNGVDVNAVGKIGKTALMFARNKDIAKILIDNGADVNAVDKIGETALIASIKVNDKEKVSYLLENKANVSIKDKDGYSAIDYAYDKDRKDIRISLLKTGAITKNLSSEDKIYIDKKVESALDIDTNVRNLFDINTGMNRYKNNLYKEQKFIDSINIHKILEKESPISLDVLFNEKFSRKLINKPNKKGVTPFMIACRNGDIERLKRYIKFDVNLDATLYDTMDKSGKTTYEYILESDKKDEILELIKNRNTTLNTNIHCPKSLTNILTNFTKDTPIKYTTHLWDFGSIKSEYGGFDGFMDAVKKQFEEIEVELKELSPNLHQKIKSFLLEKEIKKSWTKKADIKIGWLSLKGLKEWCDEGKSPFEFKLQTPIKVEDKKLRNFKEVIELFKREIEIRNENSMLESLFLKQQEKLGKEFSVELKKLKGRGFYTDVDKFETTLDRVFDAIKSRDNSKNITIEVQEPDSEHLDIKITHLNSSSHKSRKELLQEIEKGDFEEIKIALTNLCDWSVEDSDEKGGFKINYLKESSSEDIEELKTAPSGFTHIFRFYKKGK
jgi:ankyrin repeat protein